MDKKNVLTNVGRNYKSFKKKMNLTACTSGESGYNSYRLSSLPVTILDDLSWTGKTDGGLRKKEIKIITELCGNVFIIYRAEDEMKIVCKPPKGTPEINMEDDDKENLEVFRDWLITKMVAGYTMVKINCSDNTIFKSIKNKYILPLNERELKVIEAYDFFKEKNKIEATFPDGSNDFEIQIKKCYEYLIDLIIFTSNILKRLYKNDKDLTERTIGMDDEVDFSNWIIWRNVHLSLLSKSYLLGMKDPYKIAIYSAYAKTIERAADNFVGIARLSNKLYKMAQNETIKAHVWQVFNKLSSLLKEIQRAYEKAYEHFIGKDEVDLKEFKKEYINKNRAKVKKIFDSSKASQKYKGVKPDLIASVWRDLGQMMGRILRIISYPYNIVLWKETKAVDLKRGLNI